MGKPNLIGPGTPHYEERMKELTEGLDMDEARQATEWMTSYQAGSLVLAFEETTLPGANHIEAHIAHAIDYSRAESPKLIFHVKKISMNEMEQIGRKVQEIVPAAVHQIPGANIYVFAEQSPIFRSQWDFIVFGVPVLRTREIHRLILQTIQTALEG